MLLLGVDCDKLADQRARPVIKGHVAADAGAFEADLAAVSQRSVNVIIAGNEGSVLAALLGIDDGLRVLKILEGRF